MNYCKVKNRISFFLVIILPVFIFSVNANIWSSHENNFSHSEESNNELNSMNNMFVPGIGLIKTGAVTDFDEILCGQIVFTYTVTNESTAGEILENIEITDTDLGDIILNGSPVSGDVNNNTLLDPGETWIYNSFYETTQVDIDNGSFGDQPANVTSNPVGQPLVSVDDVSDPIDVAGSNPTIIDLTACQPRIAVIKTGSISNDPAGGLDCNFIDYQFEVTNEGSQILENVVLNDPLLGGDLPGPDSGDDNNDTFLDPDETWIYVADYVTTPEDINDGFVENQATATADVQGTVNTVNDLSDNDSVLEDDPTITDLSSCGESGPGIGLVKDGNPIDFDGDGCIESILYTFTVTNLGDIDLDEVHLEDPLFGGPIPGPDSESIAENNILQVGEVWIYTALYAITQDDIDAAVVINQATVSAESVGTDEQVADQSDDDSNFENQPTRTEVPDDSCTEGGPRIGLVKNGNPIDFDGDGCIESILYTFTVTNLGNIDLDEVHLEDPLLGGPIPGPDSESIAENNVLQVGEIWIYTALYAITQDDIDATIVVNQATVSAEPVGADEQVVDQSDDDSNFEDDPTRTQVPDDACTEGGPRIGLVKNGNPIDFDGDGCIESILYTFTVTNLGNIDLDEVHLEDPLLGGPIPGPDSESIAENNVLQVGEIWIYTALYAITQDDIDATIVVNQATVSAEPVGADEQVVDQSDDDSNFEDSPTRTQVPDDACTEGGPGIGLIKTGELVDIDNDGCIESIRYTFTVTNLGDFNLDEVLLEDSLFGGAIPGPVSESITENNILQVDEIWTYTALYAIKQADIDATIVVNQAIVSAEPVGFDINVFDLSDDDSNFENSPTRTEVPDDSCPGDDGGTPLFGIAMIKTGEGLDIDNDGCDDSIRYDFTVINSGSINLENVEINDELFEGQINGLVVSEETEDGILQPGEEWQYTAIYNVTQEDIDGIFVDNQASIAANLIELNDVVFDLSDDDSYQENEMTRTNVSAFCEFNGNNTGFRIYNGITPNGDGFNDYFQIVGIENYPDNNVKIFNRWGVEIYNSDNYGQGNNLFSGISEGRATIDKSRELPSGTYFYILTFTGENPGEDTYSGYLYINRD
ncbi:gliding motility-associated C-terminal domain-containing protein [Flagellimonas sp. 389]|uniref:gliding motility-associated C-terminal domain-containing protein n=1 Tax=Flagellimonas sp. 389 TaxID=2835862 RepID=UPI001BD6D24C|nr:gliding motility-associated C-terminal domain-containing protein [Flagellimonas sp. 389]MBS9462059.1 gliding motility-associated C-terminal domain-containing protein [Flagellimonas sp. 389]